MEVKALKVNYQKLNQIAEKYNLDLIVLFGSWAQGNANSNSDVDIAVVVKTNTKLRSDEKNRFDWEMNLTQSLAEAIESRESREGVDLVVLNRVNSLLSFQIAHHGKPLYERDESTFAKFQAVACLKYYDDEKFFKAVDEYLKRRYAKPKPNPTDSKKTVKHG